ncbi:MAG: hypothetical protein WBA43_16020 [Elainellaceae cyanobacterium]
MRSIHASLDLGNGLTLAEYNQAINAVRADIDTYNEALSQVDNASNAVQAGEKKLRDLSEQMLMAVAAKYGKDSSEYEMAGGTRKSERKKPKPRQPKAA